MNNGYSVLQWIHQNNYRLEQIAHKVGYARSTVSDALNNERISKRLAETLYEHYGLIVIPTVSMPWQTKVSEDHSPNRSLRGRMPGSSEEGSSKLDPYAEEIKRHLAAGTTQKDIAGIYATTPSNLHEWMRKRGLRRKRGSTRLS